MELFLDTANPEEIERSKRWGILDGVTTNPSHIAKERRPFRELVKEICALVDVPVSVEVVSVTSEEMVREARSIGELATNIVVKLPCIEEGIRAAAMLAKEGIRTNVTLVFTPTQALLAAKAGATYVSPFLARLDRFSQKGSDLLQMTKTIYSNYRFSTKIIAAAIRSPVQVLEAAIIGADVCTMGYEIMESLFKHPLTDMGLQAFLDDWAKVANLSSSPKG